MKLHKLVVLPVICVSLFAFKGFINNRANAGPIENAYGETQREEIIIEKESLIKEAEAKTPSTLPIPSKEELPDSNNDTDSPLILVNKGNSLPSDYVPKDLTVPSVNFSFTGPHEKQNMQYEAAKALEELFNAASKEGIELYAVSGYRSYNRQQTVYNGHVQKLGQEEADKISAKPGHSEHQTGLAMDVTSQSAGMSLSEDFGSTVEGIWLAENAHEYGFIIRYKKGNEDITGYSYEPWHLRYVERAAAKEIYEANITLEEYLLR